MADDPAKNPEATPRHRASHRTEGLPAELLDAISAYGQACCRDGSPAWMSGEWQALNKLLLDRFGQATRPAHRPKPVTWWDGTSVSPAMFAENLEWYADALPDSKVCEWALREAAKWIRGALEYPHAGQPGVSGRNGARRR